MTTQNTGRVLLLSSDDEPTTDLEDELAGAGFDVRRCHRAGSPAFPCNGLGGETCPLALGGGVDVVLDVRQHPWPAPTMREIGVICALRAAVPVVVVSRHGHPFEAWATTTLYPDADVLAGMRQALHDSLAPHRRAIGDAVRAVLEVHGYGESPFIVDVERRQGRVRVSIGLDVPDEIHGMVATRSAVALRGLDRNATALEIEVVPLGPREVAVAGGATDAPGGDRT